MIQTAAAAIIQSLVVLLVCLAKSQRFIVNTPFRDKCLCVHYHKSEGPARETAEMIGKAGGKAWTAGADLTTPDGVAGLVEKIKSHWDALDILVNNTGDLVQRRRIADLDDALYEHVMRVNIYSAVAACRGCIPLLKAGRSPSIINLSSVAAHHGGANGATLYATTKGAIHTFTYGLAKELAPEIRVNGIAPGVIHTDFHKIHTKPEVLESIAGNTALKRLGLAEDIGGAVVFLCAQAGAFITGEIIEINGGLWFA